MTFTTTTETSPSKPPSAKPVRCAGPPQRQPPRGLLSGRRRRLRRSKPTRCASRRRARASRPRPHSRNGRPRRRSHEPWRRKPTRLGHTPPPHLSFQLTLVFISLFFFPLQKTVSPYLILEISCFSPVFFFLFFFLASTKAKSALALLHAQLAEAAERCATMEETKKTTSASKVPQSAAVSRVSTTAASVTPF